METADLKNKLVAVLGYGLEGKATAAYLIKHGVKPVLFDQRPWEEWNEIEKLEIKELGLNFIFGPDCFKELVGFHIVFRSPGIPLSKVKGQLSNVAIITSQIKWFFEHCPCKIIGVTGTKGKGTTASLIYEILAVSLRGVRALADDEAIYPETRLLRSDALPRNDTERVFLTGNIGKIQPLEILDNLTADDWVVYELSSFQLQDLDRSPHIAVVLMVTSEHLDYHRNQQEYIAAKSAITKFQTPDDFAVINADFENSMQIGKLGKGKKIYFSRKKEVSDGCFVKNDEIVIAESDFRLPPQSFDGAARRMTVPTSDLQLRGAHNFENVCAAVSVAKILNIDYKIIAQATTGFKGLEHRLEFVGEKQGVKFYNDSFSTTPETAIAAIESFSDPEIVILGGSSKNSDFTELGKTIAGAKNIRALILIGEEAAKIKSAIQGTLTPNPSPKGRGEPQILEGAKNMKEIFAQIKSTAVKGDVVLLSSACASFDMFKSYVDRGSQFKEAVKDF